MPNLSPHGLWGWPPELAGAAPLPAQQVHGCQPDGTWLRARNVWTWCVPPGGDPTVDGSWQLAIVDVAGPPASVLATPILAAGSAQVRVDITVGAVRAADAYRVFRPDGSVVGDVPFSTPTIIDTDPRPGTGPYSVRGMVAGAVGTAATASNPVVLGQAPTWIAAGWNAGAARVDLQVHNSATSTGIRYYRAGEATSWWTGNTAPNTDRLTDYDGGPTRGSQTTYVAVSMVNGREGARANSAVVNIPPLPPQPQFLGPRNPPSELYWMRFGYWGPPAGLASAYHIQTWQDGVWTDRGNSPGNGQNPGIFDWQATNGVYARVSTIAPGGESDWAQIGPAWPITDTSPPAPASIASWQPEASYGRMVVRGYASPSGDLGTTQIFTNVGGGWVLQWQGNVPPSTFLSIAVQAPQSAMTEVIIRSYDQTGNVGTDAYSNYQLVAPQVVVDYNGAARTFVVDLSNSQFAWNDVGSNMRMGRGGNLRYYGCAWYGGGLDFVAEPRRTIVSISVEYLRREGGAAWNMAPGLGMFSQAYYDGSFPLVVGPPGAPAGGQLLPGVTLGSSNRGNLEQWFIDNIRGGYSFRGICFFRNDEQDVNPDGPYSNWMQFLNAGETAYPTPPPGQGAPGDWAGQVTQARLLVNSLG